MRRLLAALASVAAVLALSACAGKTTGATQVGSTSAMLHATASCDRSQSCTWYWEYWPASQPRSTSTKTAVYGPVSGPTGSQAVSAQISGLDSGTTYRWVFCASPNDGGVYGCAGPQGTFSSTAADPPPDYDTFTTAPQRPLAERWNGTSWTIQTIADPAGPSALLSSVSCTSATACMAVGSYEDSAGDTVTLAEHWDGTSWAIVATPSPAGSQHSVLSSVSCTAPTACTAVGTNYTSQGGTTQTVLVERWDGTSWTIQSTPTPAVDDPTLLGVSCTSATACMAVGFYVINTQKESGIGQTLAERWDGTSWTVQTTPNQGVSVGGTFYPQSTTLVDVSCTSATACTAVGNYADTEGGEHTLAAAWNGTSWILGYPQDPTDAKGVGFFLGLNGVSCSSAAACTAVGLYVNQSGQTVTLFERWNGTSWTLQPPVGSGDAGNGVSCASSTACTAVGGQPLPSGNYQPLAQAWDGTSWTTQSTPDPNPADDSYFQGVSCTSVVACTAVGRG